MRFIVVICLALGAAINGVFSWGFSKARLRSASETFAQEYGVSNLPFFVAPPPSVKPDADLQVVRRGFGWQEETRASLWHSNPPSEIQFLLTYPETEDCFYSQILCTYGWPLPNCTLGRSLGRGTAFIGHAHAESQGAPLGPEVVAEIPLHIDWRGAIFNSILFALPLFLLFVVGGRVQRTRRHRASKCPQCAYPIGQSDTCTECGAAIRRNRLTQSGPACES